MAGEKQFENKVKAFLDAEGCWYVKYWGGGNFTRSGVPDLLVCCAGRFLGVELKGPKGRPSELQKYHIAKIGEAGGIAMVLWPKDFDRFKELIRALKRGDTPDLKCHGE